MSAGRPMWLLLGCLAAACVAPVEADEPVPLLQGPQPWHGGGSTFLELGEEVVCEHPELRDQLGPTYVPDLGPAWEAQVSRGLDPEDRVSGAGAVVADLDGDGRLDIFLPEYTGCMLFLQDPDGNLRDASDQLPLPGTDCQGWSGSAADYDNDGDLDLYVGRHKERDQLWRNDGQGVFTDVSDQAGLVAFGCATRSASFGDMDGDGDLDLFVARHRAAEGEAPESCPNVPPPPDWTMPAGDPNTLYRNDGNGHFTDVSNRLDFAGIYGHSFIGGWHDLDGDLDLDLYVVNDFGDKAAPGRAYRNDGRGFFAPFDLETGLEIRGTLMGLGVGDVNEDGIPDLAISQIGRVHLMTSASGFWFDNAWAAGIRPEGEQRAAWGVELVDMNNDTLLDMPVAFGPTETLSPAEFEERRYQPDALWVRQANGSFVDEAPDWGVDRTAWGHGIVVVDFDGDGWLDLLRPDFEGADTELLLQRCGDASWLEVDLDGPMDGFGAVVQVRVGERVLTRWHDPTSTSLASSGPPGVHFGLGPHESVDELVVQWPDGRIARFEDVAARRRVTVFSESSL